MGGCFWHQPLLLASAAALLLLLASAAASSGASSDCPYTSFTWVARRADNPYFWKSPDFDWDAISTLAVFGDITANDDTIEMRDYAQSLGIKVVAGTVPSGDVMTNATLRDQWVASTVAYAQAQGLDGMNLDYEGNDPSLREAYNNIVVEVCEAMHEAIPGSSISVDVGMYPAYEGRNYDYVRMASACDSLFIMGYDGQFWDNVQCAAGRSSVNCSQACAPLSSIEYGLQQYLALGIP